MLHIREAVVVEGRYDKNALSQVVDTLILETAGFGIFKDRDQMALLRRAAERLEEGRRARSDRLDVYGKERRKKQRGREGKLGVEGMPPQVLIQSLRRAGATFLEEGGTCAPSPGLTKADLYAAGLSGRPDSGARRLALLRRLELPEHLTANGLLAVLNACYGAGEAEEILFSEAPAAAGRETEEKKEKIFPKTP